MPSPSSSSSSSPSTSSAQQTPAPGVRQPAFANWWTIKILTPPSGEHSPKTDEWCITYCTQTVRGRITSQQPGCRSLCVRRVFAHEVRNILAFRRHQDTDDDGKAKYPLPAEGQPVNVPRFLGGKPPDPDADHPVPIPPKKYWDEGWYLWTTKSTHASVEKLATMNFDLQRQARRESYKEKRRATWQEYEQFLENNQTDSPEGSKWWGAIVPPRPFPDTHADSLLVSLPPHFPLWDRFDKVLKPTWNVLGIFRESLSTGTMQRFADKAWTNAQTKEPWRIAEHAVHTAHETLFKGGKPRDGDKDKDRD
ncbi:hypothetical protein CPB85DRAFT_1223074 [Mucidula mucida]|nr:hypothetical protein CPB85DRAFT_1223074 [Mucidula mucida]